MSTPYVRYEAPVGSLQTSNGQERSIGQLLTDLSNETATLIRQEVRLATTELTAKAKVAARQLGLMATGGVLGVLGILLLLEALVVGLSAYMALWVSALIVGLAVCAIAAAMAAKGIATLRDTDLQPNQTIQSLEANKSIIQGQAK